MRFHQDSGSNGYTIHALTADGVAVRTPQGGSLLLENSFVIGASSLIKDWEPRDIDQLQPSHLAMIAAMKPEVVLLGTGRRLRFPPPALFAPLMEAGIGCEVMDNAAAARTYNILNSEGRQVIAVLLFPGP